MQLVCESTSLDDYLLESIEVDYKNPFIQQKTIELIHSIFHRN